MVINRRSLLLAGAAFPASAFAQCVINAPAVDACLGGVRNAGPAGATLDLNFMFPGSMPPGLTFTRASTATYTAASGVIQTAAVNAPRWDYDPVTLLLKGLLLEDASTNLVLQSGDMGNAAWLKSGVVVAAPVVTSNQVVAPDGTTTAARIVYPAVSGAGALSFINQAVAVTVNPYTFSVWLRGNVGGEQLYLDATAGPTYYTSARITLTTQWQRYTVTTSNLTAAGWNFCIGTDMRDTAGQTGTSAQTIYAWGTQIEARDFATSYIPTTTVAVTRAIDSCLIPPANMGFFTGSPGGSWFAEFDYFNATPTNRRVINQGNLANQPCPVFLNTARTVGQYDGVPMNAVTVTNVGMVIKAATTWANGQAKVCANGGPVASSAALVTGFAPLAANGVRFLSVGSNLSADGHLRRVVYWPPVLSDAEMQQVTM